MAGVAFGTQPIVYEEDAFDNSRQPTIAQW